MQDFFDILKLSKRDEIITAILSFVITILLHFIFFKIVPDKFYFEQKQQTQTAFEILPPKIQHKIPEFVEANPYGNELKPSDKAPVSFKNQRVADEIPQPNSKSARPLVKGENKKYKKIISGTSDKLDRIDPIRVNQVLERPLQEHRRQQTSTKKSSPSKQSKNISKTNSKDIKTSTQKQSATNAKSIAKQTNSALKNLPKPDKIDSTTNKISTNVIELPKQVNVENISDTNIKNSSQAKQVSQPTQNQQQQQQTTKAVMPSAEDIPQPKARPRLSMKIPAGPLMDNNNASSNNGLISVESKFSEFGAYQQRMIEAISRQWNLLGSKYDLSSEYGTFVIIEFSLNTDGHLVNFKVVNASSANIGKGLCQQAILSTAPYGVWTQEMVNTLGLQPQQVRIQFLYR